ncbi:XRE family transcriptional regulator [Bacillus amyloliquefaciens]|uniref:helix-turn-helix domain-containing protein n=1 Tax=Bacillus amyloliquefaciens group TaxID=1938374 RepID=UPI001CD32379|nr:XRE family transcriptional regulator [Bacillus amyloliquefaciens]MCY7898104.1 XRE family transcriptional regulator [Bacillus spizizenii]MCA1213863.1 XRE family transcriptional regulator [Bacillus amyloliquefaciens]MCY8622933.1 XRE family transcriptional regulator [Bacillus spizizenii]MCY8632164.1 XRE family transcriptional regulator [Bacillus spizizenii]MCY9362340.1 XRE family transcriptional regulator [Bacillus spizizenii]
MKNIKQFNGHRLKSARIYRGLTISELAEKAEVSKQAISQYEHNKHSPSLETLLRLIHCLGFPRDYFYEEDESNVTIGNTYFRSLLTTNKKDRASQIEKTKILSLIYRYLDKFIQFPNLNLPSLKHNGDIEKAALSLREYWGLGVEPIPNMVRVLEKNGFIVTSFLTSEEKIDAFSQRQEYQGNINYFVVLGNEKNSATRRQFDAAHELGHVILHDWYYDLELITREEFKKIEQEANQFAAELLLPKESFLNDLIYPNKLDYYVELKKKWKVSISAMIVRAYQLKALSYNQYQYLMRQISKKGWRKKEPLDNVLKVPDPILLQKAVDMILTNDVLTEDEFIKGLSEHNLSIDRKEVEMLLGLKEGTLNSVPKSNPILSFKTDV